ncbi:hypothetical protein RM574_18980 [Streptomyces sp. DSM 41982]|uniref:Integral membrane protein n=1 Tax=Streptomyces evansiae TaxID=3075535 RepID=A0ABD5E833_9ACTN|nr:hypothetical protein [Streptomyces sp. DSM 41982]MDT0417571.1 hypothetical protein [Streptomyces sp. DSM 41982]
MGEPEDAGAGTVATDLPGTGQEPVRTDEPAAGEDRPAGGEEDALLVLTAALLTPAQFPGALGDDFPEACGRLRLPPLPHGYGLILGQDGAGARWTVVVDDVSLVAVAIASWDCGMEYELTPAPRAIVTTLPGWPLALAVAAPGVPAPHDPDLSGDPEAPEILRPPSVSGWGPAQRRLGADEISRQWSTWRAEFTEGEESGAEEGAAEGGERTGKGTTTGDRTEPVTGEGARTEGGARAADGNGNGDGGRASIPENAGAFVAPGSERTAASVRAALAEARAYLDAPPPPGRIRSAFASEEARLLRVDGPGWSLVARTDDMAFVLLDAVPEEVIPVERGPRLPALLAGLDALAARS